MSFVKIRTTTLQSENSLGFDVYLKLGEKYLLYAHKADGIETDRLGRLKKRNVRHLFIKPEDEALYQKFIDAELQRLKNAKMPPGQKSEAIVGQAKAAVENVFSEPERKENFTRAQQVVDVQVAHLLSHPEALEQMLKAESVDKGVLQHSSNVATISIGLASFLGAPENVCQTVGTGALLHDLGHSKMGFDIRQPGFQMTPEQEAIYRTHPRLGAEALAGKKYISKDVLDIILLHEERKDGKGYPGGIKKLDQIFQVVGLANMYDRMVTFEGLKPEESFKKIQGMNPLPYDEELMEGLLDVLKKHQLIK